MIAIPAIDLRDGCCVQLVGGVYSAERVRLPDPLGVAREFARLGFGRIHLIDLDAATGRGDNARLVDDIIRNGGADVQAGGGLRHEDRVRDVLDAGAHWAIVGTRALRDLDWLAELAAANPGEIILAVDAKGGRVASHGWTTTLPRTPVDLAEEVVDLPLAGILVTAIDREGLLEGPDLRLVEDVAEASRAPVLASGGIASVAHLRSLEDRGAAGAVIGTALYLGALNPAAVAMEFAE